MLINLDRHGGSTGPVSWGMQKWIWTRVHKKPTLHDLFDVPFYMKLLIMKIVLASTLSKTRHQSNIVTERFLRDCNIKWTNWTKKQGYDMMLPAPATLVVLIDLSLTRFFFSPFNYHRKCMNRYLILREPDRTHWKLWPVVISSNKHILHLAPPVPSCPTIYDNASAFKEDFFS